MSACVSTPDKNRPIAEDPPPSYDQVLVCYVPPPTFEEVMRAQNQEDRIGEIVEEAVKVSKKVEVLGDEAIMRALAECLEDGYSFGMQKGENGQWLFWRQNFFSACWNYWMRRGYDRARDEAVLTFLIEQVKLREGMSISDNLNDKHLEIAKRYLKTKARDANGALATELSQRLSAARLGITLEILEKNEGFADFAKRSHLYRYLGFFGHSLLVDDNQRVSILAEGEYQLWEDLKDKIQWSEHDEWLNNYVQDGLHEESRFDWEEWKPFATGNPDEWGNQYMLKIRTWTGEDVSLTGQSSAVEDSPQLANTHAWFELYTPDQQDNIYSVGFTRPLKHTLSDNFKSPLSRRDGDLMSPDESTFWGGHKPEFSFPITYEAFKDIKDSVEEKKREGLLYQLNSENCVAFVCEYARKAGVKIDAKLDPAHLLGGKRVANWSQSVWNSMPGWLQSAVGGTTALLYNSVTLMFGAGRVAHSLALTDGREVTPYIRAHFPRLSANYSQEGMGNWFRRFFDDLGDMFRDLTDSSKVVIYHPWVLGRIVRQEFEAWRSFELNFRADRLKLLKECLRSVNLEPQEQETIRQQIQHLSSLPEIPKEYLLGDVEIEEFDK